MAPLDPAIVGKTYGPAEVVASAAAIERYADATNDDNPRYRAAAANGLIAPPLFAAVAAWDVMRARLNDPDIDIPNDRSFHGEHDMRFASPIEAGDVLVTVGTIIGIGDRSTGEVMLTEFVTRTDQGALRTRAIGTTFVRSERPPVQAASSSRPAPPLAARSAEGPAVESVLKLTEDQSFRYAGASGDDNRPHTDAGFARELGYDGVFVQGLCTMALMSQAIINTVAGRDPRRLARLKVRFANVVYPGSTLTTTISPSDADDQTYAFVCRDQDDRLVVTNAMATVRPT